MLVARAEHRTVKRKYRTAHEKVVNNFRKRANETKQIRESVDEFRTLPSRTYEILMDHSGLSDGCFAMLVPGVENESVSFIGQIAKGEAPRKIHPRGPWS